MKTGRQAKGKRPYHHGDLARALLAAAEELLAERGPEAFTLRECARRAGVSHTAPAHHFGDVTGLLTAVAVAGFGRLTENTRRARDETAGTAADRLFAICRAYVETALAHPGTFRLMFASSRTDFHDRRLEEAGSAAYAVLVETVQPAAMEAGLPMPTAHAPVVTLVWSTAHGFASLLVADRLEHGIDTEYGGDWRSRCDDVLGLLIRTLVEKGWQPSDAGRGDAGSG